jgi:HNH endonuclease
MQRIFAFDPGTSALGWAVIDADDDRIEIRACGFRLYALARQRIMDAMKQRLKPEDRVKARERRRMRLKKLSDLLRLLGLSDAVETAHWKTSNGHELNGSLRDGLEVQLSEQSFVRLIFNAHRHRGSLEFGPEHTPTRVFLEKLLEVQSNWHPVLVDEINRVRILSAVFHRRSSKPVEQPTPPVSRLAQLASDELMGVWRALSVEFGPADLTVIEAAVPRLKKQVAITPDDPHATHLLETYEQKGTRRRLHKARLFIRQSGPERQTATCALTGKAFSFDAVMSGAVEMDHDLPKARGGKGGRANLQLVLAQANRAKGAGKPAAGSSPRNPVSVADTDALRQSLQLLRSRFQSIPIAPRFSLLPSRRIAAVRHALFSSAASKDRTNLRHHALDAIVTGVAALLDEGAEIGTGLRNDIEGALAGVRLSVRLERSKCGRMHEETRYGLVSRESGFDPDSHIASRRAVEDLTPAMIAKIADPDLRQRVVSAGLPVASGTPLAFSRTRRVKIVQPAAGHVRLSDNSGAFKAAVLPADNHHMDIVQMRDGRWTAFTVTRHERRQPGWRPLWEANRLGGKLVMRLHKGDMVEWQADDGNREMLVVARLSGSSGILHFNRPLAETGSRSLVAAAASTLKKKQAKAVEASAGGRTRFRRTNVA